MIPIPDDPCRFPLSEPTPMEIALRCVEIRARWSDDEFFRRATHYAGKLLIQGTEHRGAETAIVSEVDLRWADERE